MPNETQNTPAQNEPAAAAAQQEAPAAAPVAPIAAESAAPVKRKRGRPKGSKIIKSDNMPDEIPKPPKNQEAGPCRAHSHSSKRASSSSKAARTPKRQQESHQGRAHPHLR